MTKKAVRWALIAALSVPIVAILYRVSYPRLVDHRKYSLLLKLAEEGRPAYQRMVGEYFYEKGDYEKSLQWQRRSAAGGDPIAQTFMGDYFRYGINKQMKPIGPDYVKALEWYRKAALQDYSPGPIQLGEMYLLGLGVPYDYEKAYFWSCLSLAKGSNGGIWERAARNKEKSAKHFGTGCSEAS